MKLLIIVFLAKLIAAVPISLSDNEDVRKDNYDERGTNFEGDIMISPSTFSGIADTRYRWQSAQLPYELDPAFSEAEKSVIFAGMEDISSQTCISFVKRTIERDYIFIRKGSGGCSSFVGRQGGKQPVNLQAPGCVTKGIASHELIHAIGFRHEHSRTDRDEYISVEWDNIKSQYQYAFNKYGSEQVNSFGVPYDYGSIMHYSAYAFAEDSKRPSIRPKKDVSIGQRVKLSPKDVQKINNMYKCPEKSES